MDELIGVAIRVSITYVYVLAILRLSGKRAIGSLSSLDLIVGLIIGDMFDDVFWGDVPVIQGVVGITTIILLHILVSYLSFKSTTVHRLVSASPTPVIRSGEFLASGLRSQRTRREEVLSELRLLDEDRLDEIEEAAWEPAGQVSVLKRPEARPAQKLDLPRLLESQP